MQIITNQVLNELLAYMDIKCIKFIDYASINSIKETQRQRFVLIHLVQRIEDIKLLETQFFDVFICIYPTDKEQSDSLKGYIYE